jgi:hypothetical protein
MPGTGIWLRVIGSRERHRGWDWGFLSLLLVESGGVERIRSQRRREFVLHELSSRVENGSVWYSNLTDYVSAIQ